MKFSSRNDVLTDFVKFLKFGHLVWFKYLFNYSITHPKIMSVVKMVMEDNFSKLAGI